MIDIKVNDMLVFEDEAGNTYQDCVCEITYDGDAFCNVFDYYKLTDDDKEPTVQCGLMKYYGHKFKLKEIWHRTDEDTYKKIWDRIKEEEKLTGKNLIRNFKLFKESEFEELESYKGYTILKASLNPHNSEYAIKELGFDTRFSSLADCKKYIKMFLCKGDLC